jgi:hypothetical protein
MLPDGKAPTIQKRTVARGRLPNANYPVLERLAKPSVVSCIRVLAHESVADGFVPFKNLPMDLALVVIPNLAARLREDGFDRQKEAHLFRFINAPPLIDERDAIALKQKTRLYLDLSQVIVDLTEPSHMLESRHPHQGVVDMALRSYPKTIFVV